MLACRTAARTLASRGATSAAAALAPRCAVAAAARRPCGAAPVAVRAFAGSASSKVTKILENEVKHEEEQYEQAKEIAAFLKKSEFKLVETDGDVNVALEREVSGRLVRIEWQLSSPFNPDADMEMEETEEEATDFCVTVENKSTGAGITLFCSTQTGEDHRYIIGNVKAFATAAEKDGVSGYNGPEFEDLDDKLQEAFDEYLAEVGMNNEVCDFIDAVALDKEQREYIRWLKITKAFLSE